MNDSGSFIKKLLTVHGSPSTDYLYVVHDDLDIPLGSYKIQYGRGPKDHNGLLDIYEKLGTTKPTKLNLGQLREDRGGAQRLNRVKE